MSLRNENSRSPRRTNAENRGPGSQFMSDGPGDQNVASGSGVVFTIGQVNTYNNNLPDTAANGIYPLLGRFQSTSPDELGARSQGSYHSINTWLARQLGKPPLTFRQHHDEILRQVVQGTGKWILSKKEFLDWKDPTSTSRFLWMQGVTGSGKTVLVSLIIDWLEKETKSTKDVACVYFYLQEGEENSTSLAHIWAALLKQLLLGSSDLEGELKETFYDSLQGSAAIPLSEYIDLFKKLAVTMKTVYLVIDGLDSYQTDPEEEAHQSIENALKELPDSVRVLFTSRNDSIGMGTGETTKILITPQKEDVETYVKKRIEDNGTLSKLLEVDEYRSQVIHEITNTTLLSNMFLLARLHMDNLSKQGTQNGIKIALRELPDSAVKIFDILASKITHNNRFDRSLAKHVLTWVIHAKEELNADQICESFAVKKSAGNAYQEHRPLKDALVSTCHGLIIMDPTNEILSLVHKSALKSIQNYKITTKNPNLDMAKTCLTYLLIEEYDQEGEPPLLRYAAMNWWAHVSREGQEIDCEVESLILKFLKDSTKLARSFKAIYGMNDGVFDGMTGLHAAVHFNLSPWVTRLLRGDVDIDAQCLDGQTVLHWAVRYGRNDILELLIRNKANPDLCDRAGDTPLHKALMGPTTDDTPLHQSMKRSAGSDEDMVKALIRGNARLDVQNAKGLSPMSSAIRYGPTSIAKIMAERQSDVNAEIFEGCTSLRQVFCHGFTIMKDSKKRGFQPNTDDWVQLENAVRNHVRLLTDVLLKRGVDLNRPSVDDGWTPLVYAAQHGDMSKLRRLLMRKPNPADVHLPDLGGRSSLWWAIQEKHIAAIQLLAEHGANINESYDDGSTPLLIAVRRLDSETARLLIKLGADVNMRTASGSTLLIEATKLRDYDMVWILLNAKAMPDERDTNGRSALFYATKDKEKALVWLLVTKDDATASSNRATRADNIQKSLELAMTYDNLSMAWLFYEHGASLSAFNDKGTTLLHQVANYGDLKAARFLIENGVPVDTKDAAGSTPLHYAVLRRKDQLAGFLASQTPRSSEGSQLDITDAKGNTALILATNLKLPAIMQILLRYGASCNVRGPDGMTALHHAARQGFDEGLELLLNKAYSGDPNAADDEYFTPLHHAVDGGMADRRTVKILVDAGASMEKWEKNGRTPLMLAAQRGDERLVYSLLAEGDDAQAMNDRGLTAFAYASESPEVQQLLDEWSLMSEWAPGRDYY
ncbi:ankyrin repeat-containing domain protein [Camillea tinctor]|nr:ankyrin repeat-containing domain protein [Camillea tinctor]